MSQLNSERIPIIKIRATITDYNALRSDLKLLKKMAEFIAGYRFFTLADPADSIERDSYYKNLYRYCLSSWESQLADKYPSTEVRKSRIDLVHNLLKAVIKDYNHNNNWAAMLLVEAHQKPGAYRKLMDDIYLFNQQFFFEKSNVQQRLQLSGSRSQLGKDRYEHYHHKETYIALHMPDDHVDRRNKILLEFAVVLIFGLGLAYQAYKMTDSYALASFICVAATVGLPVMVSNLKMKYYKSLPSRLIFDNLPGGLGQGLLFEIDQHIAEELFNWKSLLPPRNQGQPPSGSGLPKLRSMPDSLPLVREAIPPSVTFERKEKRKTRSEFPQLTFTGIDPQPLYRWTTREWGDVNYQSGCASDYLIKLWSSESKYDGRYMVFFPKLKEKIFGQCQQTFWDTARFGRIVHKQDEAGFLYVGKQEREGSTISNHATLFKIKTYAHEYARDRQLVNRFDPPVVDQGVELLYAGDILRTH